MSKGKRTTDIEALWKRYKPKKDPGVKEQLINHYLPLVKYIAGRLKINFPPQVEYDDLFSSGIIGLLDAIDKFDLKRGLKFETYAMSRIRGAIIDELRSLDWAPRSVRKREHELEDTYARLEKKLGRVPTDEEVAREMEIKVEDLHNLFSQLNTTVFMSLDDFVTLGNDQEATRRLNLVQNDNLDHPDMQMHFQQVRELLGRAIDSLPEKIKQMISLYYYEDLNLKEIGQVLGVSESRVCQIHTQAMLILRNKLKKMKNDILTNYV